ncbi:hypothetical protein A3K70_04655 [Candidatus Bathyarchaeota archaeon RBG_16_48_13]|nr:MAG: hypothetical protein A3K70_04655 [Candidatus Bathyarchaeota archaeon RBG_16_48_13]
MACALHGVYFGTFQALKKERNFFDVHEMAIKGINNTVESYFEHFGQKDVRDLLIELERTGLYKGLELKKNGNKYSFIIRKCLFAGGEHGVHSKIKGIDLPCPIALAIGAALYRKSPDMKIYVYPSVYESDGTVTQMDLISAEEYKKRISALKRISRDSK